MFLTNSRANHDFVNREDDKKPLNTIYNQTFELFVTMQRILTYLSLLAACCPIHTSKYETEDGGTNMFMECAK